MANTFKNALVKDVGTSFVSVYTPPASTTSICIELDVANTSTTSVTADVIIRKSGTDYYVVKNAPVPYGSSLQIIAGQKIVLTETDTLMIKSSTATSIDVVSSILEGV